MIALPPWLSPHTGAPPLTQAPVVTVVPPGPGSPAGLIASGTVGSRIWGAIVTQDSKTGDICIQGQGGPRQCGFIRRAGTPVQFQGIGHVGYFLEAGPVESNVTRVTVRLSDGQVLVLRPTRVSGGRWVAFPDPPGIKVLRVTAYSGRSEIWYTVPFNGATPAQPVFITWLRPGEAGHPRATYAIGSGVVDGQSWSVWEYAGPWGRCFIGPDKGTQECLPGFTPVLPPGHLVSLVESSAAAPYAPGEYIGTAQAPVARVTVTLPNGQVLTPAIVRGADGEKFFAVRFSTGRVVNWTAYGTSGQKLGSGKQPL